MKQKLEQLKKDFLSQLDQAQDLNWLKNLEQKYFSRQGELNQILGKIKDLGSEAKAEAGQLANQIKGEITAKYQEAKNRLEGKNQPESFCDVSLPGTKIVRGHLHPISQVQRQLEKLFTSLGFMVLDGPELESDYYNFTALNIPSDHPARDMQDTFYISKQNSNGQNDLLMRTQTSSAQVRALKKYGAPLKAIVPGRTFRREATDARHEHTFYQLEGIMVDTNINFNHLKSLLELVGNELYGQQTKLRLRPKFFPFVEPGANGEYTCFLCQGKGCRVCKQSGWLEILGCGMIHPKVLVSCNIDPKKFKGFAFGMGIDRIAMLKYGIDDIRLFYENDLRFLEQFRV